MTSPKEIVHIKFANTVKLGPKGEENYLSKANGFEITLEGILVHCKHIATGETVTTSLYNTVWFKSEAITAVETSPVDSQTLGTQPEAQGTKSPERTQVQKPAKNRHPR